MLIYDLRNELMEVACEETDLIDTIIIKMSKNVPVQFRSRLRICFVRMKEFFVGDSETTIFTRSVVDSNKASIMSIYDMKGVPCNGAIFQIHLVIAIDFLDNHHTITLHTKLLTSTEQIKAEFIHVWKKRNPSCETNPKIEFIQENDIKISHNKSFVLQWCQQKQDSIGSVRVRIT